MHLSNLTIFKPLGTKPGGGISGIHRRHVANSKDVLRFPPRWMKYSDQRLLVVAAADIVPNMVVAMYDSGAHLSIRVSGTLWRGRQSKVSAWGRLPAGTGVSLAAAQGRGALAHGEVAALKAWCGTTRCPRCGHQHGRERGEDVIVVGYGECSIIAMQEVEHLHPLLHRRHDCPTQPNYERPAAELGLWRAFMRQDEPACVHAGRVTEHRTRAAWRAVEA